MAKSTLYNIFSDLVTALGTVMESKYIFLNERPKMSDGGTPMEKFVVVSLPVSIDDYVIGNRKTYLTTSGVFYLFARSRSNDTLNVNMTGELVDDVTGLFPISGTCAVASNPVVRMTGSDGMGFQVTTVTFDLRSRWRAFDK